MTPASRPPSPGAPPRVGMDLQPPSWRPTEITADPSHQSRRVRSRIVLSFAMKGGGDPFVRWLHNRLMERLALSRTSIYADHILAPYLPRDAVPFAERETVGPFQREVEEALTPGLPAGIYGRTLRTLPARVPKMTITPDLRPEMRRPDGSFPYAGIRRDDWEVLFQSAVRSAQVAVLVLNDHYMHSDYCRAEVRMIRDENAARAGGGRARLRVVALRLGKGVDHAASHAGAIDQMIRVAMDDPRIVTVTPALPAPGTAQAHQINWTISDADLARLIAAIGPLTAG
ncbi:toll/interleukin-1 receptor domain-containing protein [Sphingomonas sp. BK235]|uniref:toll/interleukin-1 receptor domain-containing protein n=1 Tax=Sphingomonas sp. BK235 TaxID=2512131 RepID=UPI00104B23A1|nr:toll/interleukin-1 receptor domain-containing protein [Sphingomonas sp. BK235]TCP31870.1 hypothetical protein EV292_10949 [Sphingomonas sp. BK235]